MSTPLSDNITLQAAAAWAGQQHYPAATLYMVATPIGNLADITLRALHTLTLMDAIGCEDTRHSGPLLRAYGIDKPLLAVHQHNEQEGAEKIIARLQLGERIAYISDAGTPGISDPGNPLAARVRAAGLRVLPLPGASSVTTLICAAGAAQLDAWTFMGFLSSKALERARQVQALADKPEAIVLLEAPHRIAALLQALAVLGERPITIGRELSKQFEEIATLPSAQAAAWLAEKSQRQQGEFALLLHPAPIVKSEQEPLRVLEILLRELPAKTAVKLAVEITGAPRNALYEHALALKNKAEEQP